MLSLMLMLAGLLFIATSLFGKKIRRTFIAESFPVTGLVVEIKKEHQSIRNSTRTISLPVIEFKVNSLFRFKAEIDAVNNGIKVGDSVEVLVGKSNHRIAKLKRGTNELYLLLNIFLILGGACCGVSIYLFHPNDFSLSFIKDPFTALLIATGIGLFATKGYPILRMFLDYGPKYTENAYEVANK